MYLVPVSLLNNCAVCVSYHSDLFATRTVDSKTYRNSNHHHISFISYKSRLSVMLTEQSQYFTNTFQTKMMISENIFFQMA